MIDHIGIVVTDFALSKAFYERTLAPLGYTLVMAFDDAAGFGRDGKPDFWIGAATGASGHVHVALTADARAVVDAFHRAALAAGGRDNGAPGVREHYHPNYYAAFVLDPDGHNIEAVCHRPE